MADRRYDPGRGGGRDIGFRSGELINEAETEQQTKELEGRIETLESQVSRMAELEERVDFAERLLAKQREVARLPPGQG